MLRKSTILKFFVFISRSETTHFASFLFSDSYFSGAQTPKISLLVLTVASLDNHLVLHARCDCWPFVFIKVWCIPRQADRNGETVKHFYNCMKMLSRFRTPYYANLRQYLRGRSEAVRMTMHRYHTYNFRFQLLRQKIMSSYNIAAVCCNSHVQENMLSSNRFTSKAKPHLGFQNLGCHCKILGCHFDTQNGLKNTGSMQLRTSYFVFFIFEINHSQLQFDIAMDK